VKLSLDTLKNVPEGGLTEFIWDIHKNCSLDTDTWPRGFRIAELTIRFRSEMDNGGIQQYITNHPDYSRPYQDDALADVKECLECLRLIGAKESAGLLTEALALYQRYGWPFDPDKRWLDFPPEAVAVCNSIDDRWFNEEGPEPSYTRDWRYGEHYLRAHLDECVVE
jgi:hypothetical protein